jgi:anti-sigma B factor antagonist
MQLGLDTVERDGALVLTVSGELDLGSAPRLRDAAVSHLLAGHQRLVLDLSGVELLDSVGLGTVVAVFKRARSLGTAMSVVATGRARRPFELTGLDAVIPVSDDLDGALAVVADLQRGAGRVGP